MLVILVFVFIFIRRTIQRDTKPNVTRRWLNLSSRYHNAPLESFFHNSIKLKYWFLLNPTPFKSDCLRDISFFRLIYTLLHILRFKLQMFVWKKKRITNIWIKKFGASEPSKSRILSFILYSKQNLYPLHFNRLIY